MLSCSGLFLHSHLNTGVPVLMMWPWYSSLLIQIIILVLIGTYTDRATSTDTIGMPMPTLIQIGTLVCIYWDTGTHRDTPIGTLVHIRTLVHTGTLVHLGTLVHARILI